MLGTLDDPAPSPRKATFASAHVSARRSGTDCRSAEAPSPIVFFFRRMSERGPLTSRDLIGDSDHGSRTVAGRGSHRRIAHDQVVRAWSRHAERAVLFLTKIFPAEGPLRWQGHCPRWPPKIHKFGVEHGDRVESDARCGAIILKSCALGLRNEGS